MSAVAPSSTPTSAGWYPDPYGHAPLRWWDGTAWSPWISGQPPVAGAGAQWTPYGPPPEPEQWFPDIATLRRDAIIPGLIVVVLGVASNFGATSLKDSNEGLAAIIALGGLAVSAVLFPLTALLASKRWGTRRFRRDLGVSLKPIDLALGVGGAVAMLFTIVACGIILQAFDVPQASNLESLENNINVGILIYLLVLAGVIAPITEELLFRGVILRSLADRNPIAVAVVGQGVIFGCTHFLFDAGWGNIGLIVPLALVGMMLGFLVRWTGRLGAAMVAHCVFNVVQVLLFWVAYG